MAQLVLAGDVGGTKSHLGLYEAASAGTVGLVREQRYPTHNYRSLEEVTRQFIAKSERVAAACFGVPGPVIDGRAHATNVPWEMDEQAIARMLGGARVRLINDLGATAHGMLHLAPGEFEVLQRGAFAVGHGNIAVIAAGTGLGEGALVFENGRYHAVASEGGHTDFAPRDDDQFELFKFLAREFDHVSWERVLSGPGLVNIYNFMRSRAGEAEPPWLSGGDPAAAIADAALAGRDAACVRALEMFCALYGAEAANMALKVLALGGVYLGGGIAPKILPMLRRGGFLSAFLAKGRLADLLRRIEVRVSLNDSAALIGAAHLAAEMLR